MDPNGLTKVLSKVIYKNVLEGKRKISSKFCHGNDTLDMNDFIRRLAIIMIEDSDIFLLFTYHNMVYGCDIKKYQLTISDVEYLLGCVRSITKCSTKFNYDNIEEAIVLESNDNIYNNCLLLRINYGGMKGDMVMLKKAVNVIDNYNIIVKKVKYI